MKVQVLLGVLFAILLVGVRAEDDEDWSAEEDTCVNELNLNKEEIQAITKDGLVPEDNNDVKNFVHCYWQKTKMQDEEGIIHYDTVQQQFVEAFQKRFGKNPDIPLIIGGDVVRTAIRDCEKEDIKTDDHGETAIKVQNCIMKNVYKAVEEADSSEEH